MIQGIAIIGLNGSGKSTLTHALAKRLGYFEMDVEDYYFPEQRESRKWALEHDSIIETEYLGGLPFSKPRTKMEVEVALVEDIKAHPKFILSGVRMNWCDEILSHIDIVFWLQAPMEERLKRIQAREENRFGARVLAGGDMYAQQERFREMVKSRDLRMVEETLGNFRCPVIVIDGMQSLEKNLERVIAEMEKYGLVETDSATMETTAEIWDGYWKDGSLANIDLVRGEPIPEGLYHLVSEVLVRHTDGDYLLMQRDFAKPNYGGYYEATAGGSALKGEDKITCARRELLEETGITAISYEEIGCYISRDTIYYSFLGITDCDKDSVLLQKGETISYKWVSEREFAAFVNSENIIPSQKKRNESYFRKMGYI